MWTGSFFPNALGGTFSAFYLAQGLRRQGKDVEVVFLTDPQPNGIVDEGVYDGFPVRTWNIRSGSRWQRAREWMRYLLWLWRQRGRATHFHISGTSPWSLMLAWLFRLVCRRPALLKITLDGEDSLDAVDAARHGWLAGRLYRSMDAVVTMTSGQVAKLRGSGYRGLVRTIPNGVDCARFRPMDGTERKAWREKIGIPAPAEVMVYAGYLGERKGTDVLLDLFARLLSRRPGLHLLCVGNYSPTYESPEALREFCGKHGVDPAVVDHPQLHRLGRVDDMEHYLGLADVFVFPSRREGFGTVQIEAMACGLPCVVPRLPGLTEDIYPDDSTGVVMEGLDAQKWAAAVEALLQNSGRRERMGLAARARVEEVFSLDAVAARYLELYGEMGGCF
jgi:glycosyltransferase involved in cell wall biosynthesis